jgi:UDP-2,4-diacetamido-2,4,6-trideoxy-beta-L-altropyranose hydrolase
MNIVFRCDASIEIGLGHLKRCLSISNNLSSNIKHIFACCSNEVIDDYLSNNAVLYHKQLNETEEHFLRRIISEVEIDILVIDKKYNYSIETLTEIRNHGVKIVTIDILCDGMEMVNEIIIPGVFIDTDIFTPYLSSEKINQVKMGSDYIILNSELPEKALLRPKKFKVEPYIIVTTGGTDPTGVMLRLVSMIGTMNLDRPIQYMVGEHFKFRNELNVLVSEQSKASIIPFSIDNLVRTDIAISTFGVTFYELLYLGVPSLCIAHNSENAEASEKLNKKFPYFSYLGVVSSIDINQFKAAFEKLLDNYIYYNEVAGHCYQLIDGQGAKRISQLILKHTG